MSAFPVVVILVNRVFDADIFRQRIDRGSFATLSSSRGGERPKMSGTHHI